MDSFRLLFINIFSTGVQHVCLCEDINSCFLFYFQDPVSKDNVGPIRYYPEKGFKFLYFPNTGQSEWLSPIVFINMRPMPGIVVRVTCTAYASNIKHNIAKVSFDLLVD